MKFLPKESQDDKRKYTIPGGSFERDVPNDKQAIAECQEEARLKIRNIQPTGITYKDIKPPPKWAINKQPINWNGNYTEVYVGVYDGKYTGHIDKVDEDKFMITGKFYKLDEVYRYLRKEHKDALKTIYPNRFGTSYVVKESSNNDRKYSTIPSIKGMIKRIYTKTKKEEKQPTGNQNCLLCTWCVEAWFRGIDMLPRAVYSPTDKIFDFEGYDIIKRPTKITIEDKNDIKKFVLAGGDRSRFYVHFKWKNGNGGHEFLLINIRDEIYLIDAQSNILEKITSPKVNSYFRDVDYSQSFIVRADDKEINMSMLKYNDMEPKEFTSDDMKYINDNDLIKKEYTDIEGDISVNESSDSIFDKILRLNDRLNNYEYMVPNNGNPITHIKNDDFIKYYVLLSPNEFEKYKGGVCWDYVAYEAMYFRSKYPNIKFETYYQVIDNKNDNPTHTFLIFEFNKKWYWFESSWKPKCGVYGFDNKYDCIEYIMQKLKLPGKNYGTYICKFDATDATMYGMNCVGYMNYMSFMIKPYKFTNKKIEPIFIYKGHCQTDSSHNKYYRVLYGGIGIYEAFKRIVPINVWLEFKKSTACKWLPLPPKYENNYYSYFTYEGYKKFMDLTYPKMLKYLNKDKIETSIVELDENFIVYSDKYQIVATNNNYMIESEDKSELTKGFKSKTSNIQYKTLSIDKPEIYDYLKNHFSKNNPMWEGVKDSKTYMNCFINGNNSRHIKRVGEVLINKANDEVIGFEVVEKPDNYLAIEIPDKKYRGYGFGSLLLEDAIKKHGCKKLYVAKDNKIAIKMYTNRGFEKTGEFYDGEYWRMELKESNYTETSSENLFHVSSVKLANTTLEPRIPDNFLVRNGYEDNTTERIPVCKSIDDCLTAMSRNLKNKDFYVYKLKDTNAEKKTPSVKEVPDSSITNEVWLLEPSEFELVGKIHVTGTKGDGLPYTYGDNTAELYRWKWSYVK